VTAEGSFPAPGTTRGGERSIVPGMGPQSVVAEVRDAFGSELDSGQQSALISWLAFTGTFGAVRTITHAIRAGEGPFRNLSLGGEHLHHYMWGIGMLTGVGAVAVRGTEELRRHPATALVYGTGLALIVDEFALLLDLRDVYWAKQGRISVDIAVGAISLVGTYFAALPVLRKVTRRLRGIEETATGERQGAAAPPRAPAVARALAVGGWPGRLGQSPPSRVSHAPQAHRPPRPLRRPRPRLAGWTDDLAASFASRFARA
jgi:hypothetical protein